MHSWLFGFKSLFCSQAAGAIPAQGRSPDLRSPSDAKTFAAVGWGFSAKARDVYADVLPSKCRRAASSGRSVHRRALLPCPLQPGCCRPSAQGPEQASPGQHHPRAWVAGLPPHPPPPAQTGLSRTRARPTFPPVTGLSDLASLQDLAPRPQRSPVAGSQAGLARCPGLERTGSTRTRAGGFPGAGLAPGWATLLTSSLFSSHYWPLLLALPLFSCACSSSMYLHPTLSPSLAFPLNTL